MTSAPIKRLGLLAAFITVGATAPAVTIQQIKIDRALNSPTLAVKYSGVHAALMELRLNGESFGSRSLDETPTTGETTFSLDLLALKDGDNEIEIRLYDKDGHVVGSEKTTISTDKDKKGPVFLNTPKMGANVQGPVEISVGFGKDFKNSYVSFFIDNQFKAMMNVPPFTYNWDTSRESNGWHELEAWVVDDTSETFKTRKVRVFVNNPGGHTYRNVAAAVVPTPATTTKVAAPLPKPTPKPQQQIVKAAAAPIQQIAHTVAAVKTLAPAPVDLALIASANAVAASLDGQSSNSKPAPLEPSTAVGPRLMTPTGKRVVLAQTVSAPTTTADNSVPKAMVAQKTTAAPAIATKTTPTVASAEKSSPAPAPVKPTPVQPADTGTEFALVPNANTEPPVSTPHSMNPDMNSESAIRPSAGSIEPSKPVVPAAIKAAPVAVKITPAPAAATKVAVTKGAAAEPIKPASHLITVKYGTRLPMNAPYTIVLNGEALNFDVQPTVLEGVPVTPFRYLIEKSGGDVTWGGQSHEVTASTDGRDIWLKIGEKYAKIDSLAVQLEMAPFLQSGRTIVPLSFLKSALNVNIDYDKATNHVLITAKK